MKGFFANVFFYIGLFYYSLILTIPTANFIERQLKSLKVKPPDLLFTSIVALILVVSSWFFLWGRLPFPFFGFHR